VGHIDRQLESVNVEWPVDMLHFCNFVNICVNGLPVVTLSSMRPLFSFLVAKYDQDRFLVHKFAINIKTVHGCNSACER
jgi:hypothetical protein